MRQPATMPLRPTPRGAHHPDADALRIARMTSINPETTTDSVDPSEDHESGLPKMGFLDHLEELRKRLIVSFAAVTVAFFACWNYAPQIYAKLQQPLTKVLPPGDKLAFTRMTAPFFLYMK